MDGDIAYLAQAGGIGVHFSTPMLASTGAGGSGSAGAATSVQLKKIINTLDVAPWGEDNQFPQNIVKEIDSSGVAKRAIAFKSAALLGRGVRLGRLVGYEKDGSEIIEPVQPGTYPEVEDTFEENNNFDRFYTEFFQDFVTFRNCFPEGILSKDGKKLKRWVHQESCDCRFKNMDDKGKIDTVFLSKMWSATRDQYVKYKNSIATSETSSNQLLDNVYMKSLPAIDMYNPLESLSDLATTKKRNFILPVNFPSANKTYYQLAEWDGARASGWLQIASKVPSMFMALYENAFNLLWHIEIPETYFSKKYGEEKWAAMSIDDRKKARKELLTSMNTFLSGAENAYMAMVTYFDVDKQTKQELGHVKISPLERKVNVEKDLMTSAAANSEILFAFGVDPTLIGAGMPGGAYSGSSGSGSDKREAWLIFDNLLYSERSLALEPLKLMQRYNKWDKSLRFFFSSIVLNTLDKGTGTTKTLS